MRVAALVPVKGFAAAKGRLTDVLGNADRARLARWMATEVVDALHSFDVFVACDDADVREWADGLGAEVIWGPGLGLNGAIDDGTATLAAAGYDHVVISHADLPRPASLTAVARAGTVTLVPDRRRDGTNVMAFPLTDRVEASYGPGSFGRHFDAARRTGHAVEIRVDADLALDIDTRDDLHHPQIDEVLPPWLRTILANRP